MTYKFPLQKLQKVLQINSQIIQIPNLFFETFMLVTGLTLQRKKISEQKRQTLSKKKKQSRPLSSQLPQIFEKTRQSNKNLNQRLIQPDQINEKQKKQKYRHSSSNKVSMTGKIVSKKNLSSNKDLSHNQTYQQRPQQKKLSLKQIKEFTVTGEKQKKLVPKKKLQSNYKSTNTQQLSYSSTKLLLFDQVERQKLMKYFRYYPMIIVQSCLKRQAFMNSLNETRDIEVYNGAKFSKKNGKKTQGAIDMSQPWNKLIKIANLKGKYKYREKFNFIYSAQLKAISWKRKEVKKKKESSSSSEDQEQKKQKCRDMDTWKKAMGAEGSKVFIIKGRYPDFKNALLQRGWVQNPDKHSSFFDLKWTTKVSDITFQSLKPSQIVNHFNNNACLTSKYGICKSLRSIMYTEEVDIDKFFPKAFDLTDLSDFQNFIEVYKWTWCESLLKRFCSGEVEKLGNVKIAYCVVSRRLAKAETLIKNTILERYFVCSVEQWLALNDEEKQTFDEFDETFQAWDICSNGLQSMKPKAIELLDRLKILEPQFNLNGSKNIWIVKPAFLSRGRGIKCLSKFNDILNYSLGKDTQYVVQKYIQNPMIIQKRKFDIRQWVLVEDYNPAKIWVYGQFYCRFCIQEYNENKLTNKFAHLTNNSIQKYNKNMSQSELKECLKKSMWTQDELSNHIQETYGPKAFKPIRDKMKQIIISTILSTSDQIYGKKGSFELIGYDFMIDEDLNPWLIEINTSPAMDYSTPVTQRLVKMVLEDTVKVVVDLRKKKIKKKTAGLFKCVYNGEQPFVSKYYNVLQKNNQDEAEKKPKQNDEQ